MIFREESNYYIRTQSSSSITSTSFNESGKTSHELNYDFIVTLYDNKSTNSVVLCQLGLQQGKFCTNVYSSYQPIQCNQWEFSHPTWTTEKPILNISILSVPFGIPKSDYVNWSATTVKSPVKRVYIILCLLLSGDIHCNPGPSACMVCHGDIQDHHQILQCQECNLCAHTNCGGNGEPLSNQITHAKYIYWECPQCMLPNVSNSSFSLSDLDVSNSFSILDSCLEDEVFIPSEFTSSSPNPVKSTSKPTSGKKHQSIKIMFVNCRSLKSERKRHDFQELIETHQPDIICGQESHIDSTFTNGEIFPLRYNVSRKDRDIHGGGVFIAVSNKYISTTEYSLDTDCEIIWSKISIIGSKPLLIASFYRTTDDNMDPLLALNQSLRKLSNNGPLPNIILGGDLNFPDIDWENYTVKPNPQYGYRINRLMLEIAEEHGLQQLQKEPTRLHNVLDLLFTTYPDLVENVQVSSGMSDHCVVTAEVNVNPRAYKKPPRKVYMFKKMNVTQMKQDALDFKDHYLNHTSDANHIDVNWTTFKTKVSEILSDNVPTKTIKEKWDVPWMNSSINPKRARGGGIRPPFDIFCYISAGCYFFALKLLDFFSSSLALNLRPFL